ncbi:PKD domain-containing protein [Methanoregula sp.]|uniref:PKD domain-containing protein n=1 Tax=Methanoregula sp. TaxID=2052170 RepID=UPI003C785C35
MWAQCTLESYGIVSHSELVGSTTFTNIALNDVNGDTESTSWSRYINETDKELGGLNVDLSQAPSIITLDTDYDINPAPVASFATSATTGVAPLSVQFTDTSTNSPMSWSWTFGDGSTSTQQNPTHIYQTAGTYTVSLLASNMAGSNTITKNELIAVSAGDPNQRVTDGTFSGGSLSGWTQNGGSGYGGLYQIQGESSNGATSSNGYALLTANSGFSPSGYANAEIAQKIDLTSVPKITYYLKNEESSGTSDQMQVTLDGQLITNVPNPGGLTSWTQYSYVIPASMQTPGHTLEFYTSTSDGGMIDMGVSSVSALATAPVALFTSSSSSGTIPFTVSFMDQSQNTPTSWAWNFGDGTSSNNQNPSHQYTTAGSYTVSLTASNSVGQNTITKSNYVSASPPFTPTPVAGFTVTPTTGTIPLFVTFIDESSNTPTSWSWNFGDGSTSTSQSPSHTYSTSGTYSVSLTAKNSGGSNTITKTNLIKVTPPEPVASFTSSTTSGTAPLTVQFTDTSTNTPSSWLWTFGDGSTSTQQNPTHTYSSPGTYTVNVTATNAGGSGVSASQTITITTPKPVASFTESTTSGTIPLAVQFTDNSTNSPTSWYWVFGDGNTSTFQDPVHTYNSPENYTVNLTATNAGGSSTSASQIITVIVPKPVASFTANSTSGTAPLAVQFTDSSTNTPTSWLWNFGDGNTSTSQNPAHTYTSPDNYTVYLTATNAGGSGVSASQIITVIQPKPVASFTENTTSGTAPLTVQFTDTSTNTPTQWNWTFSDGTYSSVQNPEHTYTFPGVYAVYLIATNAVSSNVSTQMNLIQVKTSNSPGTVYTISNTTTQVQFQNTIEGMNDGDTLLLNPGIYWVGNITFYKSITIASNGGTAQNTILDGSRSTVSPYGIFYNYSAYSMFTTLTLENLTFQNSRSSSSYGGGAVYSDGNITVISSQFVNDTALGRDGGAIGVAKDPGNITVVDSTFTNCSAYMGGAIFDHSGYLSVTGSTFTNCSAINTGSAVYASGGAIYGYNGGTVNFCNFFNVTAPDNNIIGDGGSGVPIETSNNQIDP